MALTPMTISPVQLAATVVPYYTVSDNSKGIIKKLTFTNATSGNASVTVHLVPKGGIPGPSNILVASRSIGSKVCYDCKEAVGQVLQSGGTIQAMASNTGAITIHGAVAEVM